MPDPDKSLWGNVHQKAPDKLNPWQSQLFPLSFTPVIFHRKGYVFFIHADDPMVADRNAVGIFAEIFDHGLGTMECLFAVGNPLCAITGIQQFFKGIMVTELFSSAMKDQLILFPQFFQFLQIFPAEHFGNDLDGEKEVFPVVFPLIVRGQGRHPAEWYGYGDESSSRIPMYVG